MWAYLEIRVDQSKAVKKVQSFQELFGKVSDALYGKGMVFLGLQKVVERGSEGLENHTIMAVERKCIVHDGTMRCSPPSVSIDVSDNVGLDFCRIVISFDVSNNFYGDNIIRIVLVVMSVFSLMLRMIALLLVVFSLRVVFVVPILSLSSALDIKAFYNPSKRSHTHFLEDSVPIGKNTTISPLEMSNGVVVSLFGRRRRSLPLLLVIIDFHTDLSIIRNTSLVVGYCTL